MTSEVHYLGIRHHGPGSARQLVKAFDEIQPQAILIEGASDQSDLIPFLGDPQMKPPVALLSYPKDKPEEVRFWPFAEFSPEYQAIRWALKHNTPVRFIDLPSSWKLAEDLEEEDKEKQGIKDPIGELAKAAGYEDGESWWNEILEENPASGPIFEAIALAMETLRENEKPKDLSRSEAAREAYMRLEINKEKKNTTGAIAVVCGAYHVPALKRKHALKDDRAAIKSSSKRKMLSTWAPWTSMRLATISGYGAGVSSPRWYKHLWTCPKENLSSHWLVQVARTLRENGYFIPSASIIEAERLATSLAILRNKAIPGYEELREASIACLCFGETILWEVVETNLLIGNDVGTIPENIPLSPLMEDLARQQKKARLKPEALERDLSLDLRSEPGLFKSTLLHQLNILGVPWGSLQDTGRSRGTFRENWSISWKPEFAVELIENLVYGTTINQAAGTKLIEVVQNTDSLPEIGQLILDGLTAQLMEAASKGIALLQVQAAQSSDCLSLLQTLSPLSNSVRYGEARTMNTEILCDLFDQISLQAALSLPYACHQLDQEAALNMKQTILDADSALNLIHSTESEQLNRWHKALNIMLSEEKATCLLVGVALRLLYEAEYLPSEETMVYIQKQLSPGTKITDAADFFEGFFDGAGTRLIYDNELRKAVNKWLMSLDQELFNDHLPIFRRVFSSLDTSERSHLYLSLIHI